MTIDYKIKFDGKEFDVSCGPSGCGRLFVLREKNNGGCKPNKMFQVYKTNRGYEIASFNESADILPYFKKFIEKYNF